jgi:uncharacterized protein (DUF58 family)
VALIRWLPVLGVAFFLGLIIHQPWLVLFAVAVTTISLLGYLWGKHALDRVTYRRRWRYRRGFPGEHIPVQVEIENNKLLPVSWLHAEDPWSLAVGPADPSILSPSHVAQSGLLVNLGSLRWHARIRRKYDLLLRQRGIYPVGPASLSSGDLFGLADAFQVQENVEYLTVFPELIPRSFEFLPTDDPFGDRRSRRRLFEDINLPIGIRPYQPEDEFRYIHWAATARSGSLQVKVFQPVTAQVMVVCLNVTTANQAWLGIDTQLLEQLIKVSASVVYQSFQCGYSVGLISNCYLAHADHPFNILPGRSRDQLGYLLEALAAVTPYTSTSFEAFLVRSLPGLPYGATLLLVTAVVTPALVETLLRLKRYRANTTLISLDPAPPPEIPGVRVLHMPYHAD